MPGWLGVVTCRLVMVWMARAWGKDVRCHKRFCRTDWDVTWTLVMEPARRWKVVERLLSKAEKSSPEAAFKVLKETLVRMQAPVSWLWVLIYRASLVIEAYNQFCMCEPVRNKRVASAFFASRPTLRYQPFCVLCAGDVAMFETWSWPRPFDDLRRQNLIQKCATSARIHWNHYHQIKKSSSQSEHAACRSFGLGCLH